MIKQQVNLYQPVLYIQRQLLTLSRLAYSWLALVVVLALAFYLLQQQSQRQTEQLVEQQRVLDTAQQENAMYQQALAQRQPAPELLLQHQQLLHSVQQKQHLLSYLAGQQQQASLFYSPVLQHLQQIDRRELWLTRFSLQQQYSSFAGIALQPEVVPQWLTELGKLSYFHGQRFGQIDLQQVTDKTAVNFSLTATPGALP